MTLGLLAQAPASAPTDYSSFINLAYLVAAGMFIFGLKAMSHPRTARNGNLLSSLGMLIAIVATLLDREILSYWIIFVGILVGSAIGAYMARTVKMTGMPQMVGLLNGFGGLASACVALAEFAHLSSDGRVDTTIAVLLGVLIGAITFTGSLIAFGKLESWKFQGKSIGNPIVFPNQHPINMGLGALVVLLGAIICGTSGGALAGTLVILILLISLALGVLLVIPIGGADMPVIICLLNSYSGLAAMATGFAIDNKSLIITGSLVGASGIILTQIMCKAMNRSLLNVVAGGFGTDTTAPGAAPGSAAPIVVRKMDAEEAAMVLEAATNVIIIPGYGMAVAQAQHAVADLANTLIKKGVKVRFAIHPVAGRMPGHMNVLLAEANVDYGLQSDLAINPEFEQCDAALVIGANDVVNPAARHDKNSPIYGMPIFDCDKSRTVMVIKRSLNPGFAGIENELFGKENTVMLFGDAKAVVTAVSNELKQHG